MYLVVYQDTWADEITIAGSKLFEEDYWKLFVKLTKEYFAADNYLYNNIGTNETIEYSSFEEWAECYQVIKLSDLQAAALEQIIKENYCYQSASQEQFFYPVEQVYPEEKD